MPQGPVAACDGGTNPNPVDTTTTTGLDTDNGREVLTNYDERFVDMASKDGRGIVLETATRRVSAAQALDVPAVVSFSVETDGRLTDGTSLAATMAHVDEATAVYPASCMVNGAHPQHFAPITAAVTEVTA